MCVCGGGGGEDGEKRGRGKGEKGRGEEGKDIKNQTLFTKDGHVVVYCS